MWMASLTSNTILQVCNGTHRYGKAGGIIEEAYFFNDNVSTGRARAGHYKLKKGFEAMV